MRKKVGNVVLDYEFYPGQDLYSDGKVEEELLEISRNYQASEWNHMIAAKKSWPVLYHFSHIRQNIVNWLPIRSDETVLEIGSGCGAITGALAKKAKKVTCIELSEKRSLINAHRNQEYTNVEILLGNFQDVVAGLEETFDYITLIGVFEYSEGYIQSNNPYVDMLKKVFPLLKPKGKLVIAIENRLGLKYWAGCTEDHVGRYFEGLEGYPGTKGVRTFSKKELSLIFQEAGEYYYQMYYPYPDYKFPFSVFSDDRLPGLGELRENNYNFDRERVRLFDETRVYDSLILNELYGEFANSFLLIASKEPDTFNTTYVKCSNERADRFAVRTEIQKVSADGVRVVRKYAESEQGKAHLHHIYRCCQKLARLYQDTPIRLNQCTEAENCIELEFLEGKTLEEILDAYVEKKQYLQVWSVLKQYLEVLKSVAVEPFKMTDEFQTVFGNAEIPSDALCAPITNIDAICANIIWGDKTWKMLDYEWSFEFPVPVDFQIYRVLRYYLYSSTVRGCLQEMDFFGKMGITPKEMETYDNMEQNFQKYILGGMVPLRDMYKTISPGVIEDIKTINANDKKLRVYVDYGEDFREDHSFVMPREKTSFKNEILLPEGAVRLRLDPCEESCIVHVGRLTGILEQGETELAYICNGTQISDRTFFFETADPYFIIEKWPEDMKGIYAELELQRMSSCGKGAVEALCQYNRNILQEKQDILQEKHQILQEKHQILQEKHQILQEKQHISQESQLLNQKYQELLAKSDAQARLITEMENTKVWKAYSFYKRRGKRT